MYSLLLSIPDTSVPSIGVQGRAPVPNGSRLYTVSVKGQESAIRGTPETIDAIRTALGEVKRAPTEVISVPIPDGARRLLESENFFFHMFEGKQAMSMTPALAVVLTALEKEPEKWKSDISRYFAAWALVKTLMRITVEYPMADLRLSA